MKNLSIRFFAGFILLMFSQLPVSGIDTKNTRMMSQPAISANHIAFIYAEDLWIANADGSQPRRLQLMRELNRIHISLPTENLLHSVPNMTEIQMYL